MLLTATCTISGFIGYLNKVLDMDMPPNQYWYCNIVITTVQSSVLCSTYFIVSMTFERFYSIIKPHRAASFNTVKRAKITITCIAKVSILYNLHNVFLTDNIGIFCIPAADYKTEILPKVFYWLSFILFFTLPFVLLLAMNSVIIYTIGKRSKSTITMSEGKPQGQSQGEGQRSKSKHNEIQIYVMLLLVTFGFLILVTPAFVMFFYINFFQGTTPYFFAGYHLFYQVGEKTMYTNHGINFFLYVISGQTCLLCLSAEKPNTGIFIH